MNRLQCGGGPGGRLAPPCPAAGHQLQEGEAGLRLGRRSAAAAREVRSHDLFLGAPEVLKLSNALSDLVLLDDDLNVKSTFISGEEVWRKAP